MGNSKSQSTSVNDDYNNADVNDTLLTLNLNNERGVAFIVSNEYLCNDKKLDCSTKDSKEIDDLFREKGINYSSHVRTNVRYKKFIATCKYLATYQYYPETCQAIVIYFSGHGGNGFISMEGEKGGEKTKVEIQKLKSLFTNTKLARVFFIDTCRGSESDSGCTSSAIVNHNTDTPTTHNQSEGSVNKNDTAINHASQGNDLVAFSTSEGYVAYSDEDGGSWTKTLVLQLRKCKQEDICSVLHRVNRLMVYKNNGSKKTPAFQAPEFIDRLHSNIYLWDRNGK